MARMNGYYCELCPAGYEPNPKNPSKESFGCTPCPIGYFKAAPGNVIILDISDINGQVGLF